MQFIVETHGRASLGPCVFRAVRLYGTPNDFSEIYIGGQRPPNILYLLSLSLYSSFPLSPFSYEIC
ncbi:MAG: hypothetical protein VSS75_033590 [Candidatus Parabeggiatoa sp.]